MTLLLAIAAIAAWGVLATAAAIASDAPPRVPDRRGDTDRRTDPD